MILILVIIFIHLIKNKKGKVTLYAGLGKVVTNIQEFIDYAQLHPLGDLDDVFFSGEIVIESEGESFQIGNNTRWNLRLRGVNNATLKLKTNFLFTGGYTSLEFNNITVDGDNKYYMMWWAATSAYKVKNCVFKNLTGNASFNVQIDSLSSYAYYENCTFENIETTSTFLFKLPSKDVTFLNCTFKNISLTKDNEITPCYIIDGGSATETVEFIDNTFDLSASTNLIQTPTICFSGNVNNTNNLTCFVHEVTGVNKPMVTLDSTKIQSRIDIKTAYSSDTDRVFVAKKNGLTVSKSEAEKLHFWCNGYEINLFPPDLKTVNLNVTLSDITQYKVVVPEVTDETDRFIVNFPDNSTDMFLHIFPARYDAFFNDSGICYKGFGNYSPNLLWMGFDENGEKFVTMLNVDNTSGTCVYNFYESVSEFPYLPTLERTNIYYSFYRINTTESSNYGYNGVIRDGIMEPELELREGEQYSLSIEFIGIYNPEDIPNEHSVTYELNKIFTYQGEDSIDITLF